MALTLLCLILSLFLLLTNPEDDFCCYILAACRIESFVFHYHRCPRDRQFLLTCFSGSFPRSGGGKSASSDPSIWKSLDSVRQIYQKLRVSIISLVWYSRIRYLSLSLWLQPQFCIRMALLTSHQPPMPPKLWKPSCSDFPSCRLLSQTNFVLPHHWAGLIGIPVPYPVRQLMPFLKPLA